MTIQSQMANQLVYEDRYQAPSRFPTLHSQVTQPKNNIILNHHAPNLNLLYNWLQMLLEPSGDLLASLSKQQNAFGNGVNNGVTHPLVQANLYRLLHIHPHGKHNIPTLVSYPHLEI